MIISASRRTDIPSFYSEWFINRIREGYAYVRNPMNIHQIGKISLDPSVVDGMVIWTKNPIPLMNYLDCLDRYNYYFQFTLTPYGPDVESDLPSKNQKIIPTFCELSKRIGKDRVIWRYDPIYLNDTYTFDYHIKYFEVLAHHLADYAAKCTVSFLDLYKNTERNVKLLGIRALSANEQIAMMRELSIIAKAYGLQLDTCAEEGDFSRFGVQHGCCIDKNRLEKLGKYHLDIKKDKNQRSVCGCDESIDIGTYNTCRNGCAYCYANYNRKIVEKNVKQHDPNSPLLFGKVGDDDVIKVRKMKANIVSQLSLFDI